MNAIHRLSFLCFALIVAAPLSSSAPLPAGIPDTDALQAADKALHEKYAGAFALTKREDRVALSQKLLDDAAGLEPKEAAMHFLMLRTARDIAGQAGDATDALRAVDAIDGSFAIDAAEMRIKLLGALEKSSADSPADSITVARKAFAQVEAATARHDDKSADALLPIAEAAALRGSDPSAALLAKIKAFRDQRSATVRLKALIDKLAENPADPTTNLAAGNLLCFERGDFDAGLPLLKKGSDFVLARLAERDLAAGDASIVHIALGHDWWDVADTSKGSGAVFARRRAATWYRSALADLQGPRREMLEKRIAEADQSVKTFFQNGTAMPFDAKGIGAAQAAIDSAAIEPLPAEALGGDKTIAPAAGDKPYALPGPITVPDGVNATLTIAAGTEIRGSEFQMGRSGHMVAAGTKEKPVIFRNVVFQNDLGGSFEGEWVIFENCHFLKQCCWFLDHSSKWKFTNCVLCRCKFGGLTGVDYGFQIRHCALVSMELPEIAYDQSAADFDHMKHLRGEWNFIQNCDFVDCNIPPTVAWCAERCNFIGCGFIPGEAFRSADPLTVVLYLTETRSADPRKVWSEAPPAGPGAVTLETSPHAFDGAPFFDRLPIPDIHLDESGLAVFHPIVITSLPDSAPAK